MSLSRREQIMLAVLVILGLLAIAYYLVFIPQSNKYDELSTKQLEVQTTYDTTMAEIGQLDKLEAMTKDLTTQIDSRTQRYFPSIIQEQIVLMMNQLYTDSQIQVNNENFTISKGLQSSTAYTSTIPGSATAAPDLLAISQSYNRLLSGKEAPIAQEPVLQAEPNEEQKMAEAAALGSVESLNQSIVFVGSYTQATDLIRRIEALNRSIQVKNVAMAVSTAQDQTTTGPDGQLITVAPPTSLLDCTFDLVFNAIPKLTAQDEAYEAWTLTGAYGKADPFAK
jgi:type IV pilus assembly protein PilO